MLKPSKYFSLNSDIPIRIFGQIEYAESEFENENFSKILQNPQNMQNTLKYL